MNTVRNGEGFIKMYKILKESDLEKEHQEKMFAGFLAMSEHEINFMIDKIEKGEITLDKLDDILTSQYAIKN